MILLLDTHALLWALAGGRGLSRTARAAIEDGANVVLASVASGWEIAIKRALGRLDAPGDLESALDSVGFTKRLIHFADVRRAGALPGHHRDPFDRLLVAQALEDGVPIVSRDPALAPYGVPLLW